MGIELGKINEILSFVKLNLICFNEQGLVESDVLLKLDTRSIEFMDYKDICRNQKIEKKLIKTQYICAEKSLLGKKILKRLKNIN